MRGRGSKGVLYGLWGFSRIGLFILRQRRKVDYNGDESASYRRNIRTVRGGRLHGDRSGA